MKKLMTIMMAIVIAVTSFHIAPVQTASAEEAGERVLYTRDYGNGDGTRAIVSADGKTVNYYGVKFATDKQDEKQAEKPDTNIVIGEDGFAFVTTIISKNEKYKIIENNDYRFKLEDCYGQIYLMDDTHFLTKISGDMTGTADWVLADADIDTTIGVYNDNMLWEAKDVEKIGKGHAFKLALMGVDGESEEKQKKYNSLTTWTSSNPSVATVDDNGIVKGKAYGTATITAKFGNADPTYVKVSVVKNIHTANVKRGDRCVIGDNYLRYSNITKAKWDKKGNLVCTYTNKTVYDHNKKMKKVHKKYKAGVKIILNIKDEYNHKLLEKKLVIKKVAMYSGSTTFVVKKKAFSKSKFDLVRANVYIDCVDEWAVL